MLPFVTPTFMSHRPFPIVQDFVQPTASALLTQTVNPPAGATSLMIEAYGYGGRSSTIYAPEYDEYFYLGGNGGDYARWSGTAQSVVIHVPGKNYTDSTYSDKTQARTVGGTILASARSGLRYGSSSGQLVRTGGDGATRLESDFVFSNPNRICGGGGGGGPTANGGNGQPWNETNTTVLGSGGAGGGGLAGAGGTSVASPDGQNYGGGAARYYDWALPGGRGGQWGDAILRLTWS